MRGWAIRPTWWTSETVAPWWWMRAGTCALCAGRRRSRGSGWRSPRTPTCTPTSSPARCSSPPPTGPPWSRRRRAAASSRTPGLRDGDELDLGGLRLRALATPGHTPEHVAFLLLDGEVPVGVFTGGSLLVGSAARTDLVDPDRTVELARAQYASLQRLLALPDGTAVWPTHGAGSFCSAPPGAERTTTIGREKATNPLLAGADEDAFVARLLAGLGSYPPYFARLGEVNRRGPSVVSEPVALAAVDVEAAQSLIARGGQVVDVRPIGDYAAGHMPGSVSIPLRDAFATWLGWLIDPVAADPDRRQPRSGPRGDSLAGAQGRLREPRRGTRRRHRRVAGRQPADHRHPARRPRPGHRPGRARHPPGHRVRRRARARRRARGTR